MLSSYVYRRIQVFYLVLTLTIVLKASSNVAIDARALSGTNDTPTTGLKDMIKGITHAARMLPLVALINWYMEACYRVLRRLLSLQPLPPSKPMRRNLTPKSMIPAQGVLPSFEVAPPILVPQQLTLKMGYKLEKDSSTESH
ncbi:hypothetical protein FA13DRAFT_1712506 [Coprinellus micaceus]|uniref:Uncharacterized protein n=1 Tax=Coprinellus micaceus TaxID=71717 RepID=A0A4Y7T0D7_COPMI|nr:hypothetical protein FA13DRAFT_1712506 [Coprinellus micaceus]